MLADQLFEHILHAHQPWLITLSQIIKALPRCGLALAAGHQTKKVN